MTHKKIQRADKLKWPGVYIYETGIIVNGKPDIVFYITYKDGKKKIWEKIGRKSEGFTPQIADDIRKDRTIKARHGDEVLTAKQVKQKKAKQNRTIDEIFQIYIKQRGGSPAAAKSDEYKYDKHVKPLLGKKSVSNISELDIKRIEKAMQGKAAATLWGALEMVRRISNFGKRMKLSDGLSFVIQMPKLDNQIVEFLTPEQAGGLLKVLDAWPIQDVPRMLKVAMLTGMRRGELFKLQDNDIDYQNKLINIRSPKGGKTVSIPLSPAVEEIIKDQIKWRVKKYPESIYIFAGKGGKIRVDCSAAERIKEAASLPKKFRIFHGLRHHYAVTLANSGEFTLDMIGELLTHKSHDMTKRYAQFLPGSLKKAGQRAAELVLSNVASKPETPESEAVNE